MTMIQTIRTMNDDMTIRDDDLDNDTTIREQQFGRFGRFDE
jgi:hypothetical protein